MSNKRFNAREISLVLGITVQGVQKQIKNNCFPNASLCECKRTMLIPERDLKAHLARKNRK